MSEQRYDIVDVVEDIAKVGYSVGVFAAKVFYGVSNVESIKNGMDAYMLSRFSQRLEYFTHEHDKLSIDQKNIFYDDLKSNKQNLNYLYEFVEKARTTTYELHAKILARMSAELIKNKKLNFYESILLANLNTLTYEDFEIFKNALNEIIKGNKTFKEQFGKVYTYETRLHWKIPSIEKFLNMGLISKPFTPPNNIKNFENVSTIRERVYIVINQATLDILKMLDELMDE